MRNAIVLMLLFPFLAWGQWVAPVGIPVPPFGITQTAGSATYYIDNTDANATDTNNENGTALVPRKTWPSTVAAGSVVEVHGGPYTFTNGSGELAAKNTFGGSGTAENPIFFRGTSSLAAPTVGINFYISGSYVIVENVIFSDATIELQPRYTRGDIANVSIRSCVSSGTDPDCTTCHPGVQVGNWNDSGAERPWSVYSVSNVVIYNNVIHNIGNPASDVEQDTASGILINGQEHSNIWVIDNNIYDLGGDCVRNGENDGTYFDWGVDGSVGNNTAHNTYIGRNIMSNTHENAVDVKRYNKTVVSGNTMYNFQGTGSSQGDAISIHYNTKDLWVLNNLIYNVAPEKTTLESSGIKIGAVYDIGNANPVVVMGNVIYDCNQGIRMYTGGPMSVLNNTIANCNGGINDSGGASDFRDIRGNIIDTILLPLDSNHYHLSNATAAAGYAVDYNLFYQDGGTPKLQWMGHLMTGLSDWQTHTTGSRTGCEHCPDFADPLFVSRTGTISYAIQSGSPARNSAPSSEFTVTVGDTTQTYPDLFNSVFGFSLESKDISGNPRMAGAAYDIGAYEYQEPTSTTTTTTIPGRANRARFRR